MNKRKHIVFISWGKDSLAQLILMILQGIHFDEVVYVDIRFNKKRSGEHRKMEVWIPIAKRILWKRFGIKVKVLKAKYTFQEYFYKQKEKGDKVGEIYGFPYTIGAWCNSRLKVQVINEYINSLDCPVTEYVGIAYDEPWRYVDLVAKNNDKIEYRSILFEQKITEEQAFEICRPYDLISPKYKCGGFRGGCWFCVKQCYADLYELWREYPEDFQELVDMEKESPNRFNRNMPLSEIKKRFEEGYVPKRITKRKKIFDYDRLEEYIEARKNKKEIPE